MDSIRDVNTSTSAGEVRAIKLYFRRYQNVCLCCLIYNMLCDSNLSDELLRLLLDKVVLFECHIPINKAILDN